MRVDERRTIVNVRRKRTLKSVLKDARETRAVETIRNAISQIDKAVKNKLIHANKAARLKSQLMSNSTPIAATSSKPKKIAKKASVKKTTTKKTSAKKSSKK